MSDRQWVDITEFLADERAERVLIQTPRPAVEIAPGATEPADVDSDQGDADTGAPEPNLPRAYFLGGIVGAIAIVLAAGVITLCAALGYLG